MKEQALAGTSPGANLGADVRIDPGRPDTLTPQPPAGRWKAWLHRRVPPRRTVLLTQRNVFIFPPREGLAYGVLILLLILAAINYQNSLVFGLAFLLGSTFAVAIGHTFRNLAGLTVEASGAHPVFAGEHAVFRLRLTRDPERDYFALRIGWPGEPAQVVDLDDGEALEVRVPYPASRRGWLNPGRLRIETLWPLGLLRAWTWVDLEQRALVYPRPEFGGSPAQATVSGGDGEVLVRGGADDFLSLREYRPGDPLKHVAWKSFAREGELLVKEFGGYADRRLWLDWESLPGVDTETRLSRLCGWALELERSGDEYGLRLPGTEIPPSKGDQHRAGVLRALALFGVEDPMSADAVPTAASPS